MHQMKRQSVRQTDRRRSFVERSILVVAAGLAGLFLNAFFVHCLLSFGFSSCHLFWLEQHVFLLLLLLLHLYDVAAHVAAVVVVAVVI